MLPEMYENSQRRASHWYHYKYCLLIELIFLLVVNVVDTTKSHDIRTPDKHHERLVSHKQRHHRHATEHAHLAAEAGVTRSKQTTLAATTALISSDAALQYKHSIHSLYASVPYDIATQDSDSYSPFTKIKPPQVHEKTIRVNSHPTIPLSMGALHSDPADGGRAPFSSRSHLLRSNGGGSRVVAGMGGGARMGRRGGRVESPTEKDGYKRIDQMAQLSSMNKGEDKERRNGTGGGAGSSFGEDSEQNGTISFTRPEAYLVMKSVNLSSPWFSLSFSLKTVQKNGLMILYNEEASGALHNRKEFIALELSRGHISLTYQFAGGGGPRTLAGAGGPVNDYRWHRVSLRARKREPLPGDVAISTREGAGSAEFKEELGVTEGVEGKEEHFEETFEGGRRGTVLEMSKVISSTSSSTSRRDEPSVHESTGSLKNPTDGGGKAHSAFQSPPQRAEARHDAIEYIFTVDNDTQSDSIGPVDLSEGRWFIGGASRQTYQQLTNTIRSTNGYQGCMASLTFGDILLTNPMAASDDLSDIEANNQYGIKAGCPGPSTECSKTSCENDGVCIQEWNNSRCDCELTSFTGPVCGDESIAYRFGKKSGMIRLRWSADPGSPDSESLLRELRQGTVVIVLGVITSQLNSILVRLNENSTILSSSSSEYVQISLVGGQIRVDYNVGRSDHYLQEPMRVNDDAYHVIRFILSPINASLRIDGLLPRVHHILSGKRNVDAAMMQRVSRGFTEVIVGAGGDSTMRRSVRRPFHGTLAGVLVNHMRILDIAAEPCEPYASLPCERYNRFVTIEGDIKLDSRSFKVPGNRAKIHGSVRNSSETWTIFDSGEITNQRSPVDSKVIDSRSDSLIYAVIDSNCHRQIRDNDSYIENTDDADDEDDSGERTREECQLSPDSSDSLILPRRGLSSFPSSTSRSPAEIHRLLFGFEEEVLHPCAPIDDDDEGKEYDDCVHSAHSPTLTTIRPPSHPLMRTVSWNNLSALSTSPTTAKQLSTRRIFSTAGVQLSREEKNDTKRTVPTRKSTISSWITALPTKRLLTDNSGISPAMVQVTNQTPSQLFPPMSSVIGNTVRPTSPPLYDNDDNDRSSLTTHVTFPNQQMTEERLRDSSTQPSNSLSSSFSSSSVSGREGAGGSRGVGKNRGSGNETGGIPPPVIGNASVIPVGGRMNLVALTVCFAVIVVVIVATLCALSYGALASRWRHNRRRNQKDVSCLDYSACCSSMDDVILASTKRTFDEDDVKHDLLRAGGDCIMAGRLFAPEKSRLPSLPVNTTVYCCDVTKAQDVTQGDVGSGSARAVAVARELGYELERQVQLCGNEMTGSFVRDPTLQEPEQLVSGSARDIAREWYV